MLGADYKPIKKKNAPANDRQQLANRISPKRILEKRSSVFCLMAVGGDFLFPQSIIGGAQ